MEALPTPTRTPFAQQWLQAGSAQRDRAKWALLSQIDGHRNVVELESVARAMGLDSGVLERLRCEGLIDLDKFGDEGSR
jgi:hypothetical protein